MNPRAAKRNQAGFTLIEVLLVVAITSVLLVPLMIWTGLALRQQPVTQDGLVRIAGTGLVSHYLPKDIAVAGAAAIDEDMADAADVNFEDCRGGQGEDGRRLLVLIRGGPTLTKIVYSESDLETTEGTDPSRTSLWRRECNAADGLDTRATQLLEEVETGSTTVTCPAQDPEAPCRHIELRTTPVASGQEVAFRGMRRVDAASVVHLVTDNRVPVAKIDVLTQAPRPPYEVTFSSARSHDPDGQIVCYQWVFPTSAEGQPVDPPGLVSVEVPPAPDGEPHPDPPDSWCPNGAGDPGDPGPTGDPQLQVRTFPTSGVYYVELTVTDDKGFSTTTYKRIEIVPPDPIAGARAQSVSGSSTAGESVFEFAARWVDPELGEVGSEHPDGEIVEYEWVIVADAGGPDSAVVARRSTPDPWYTALPDWMAGSVTVVLTVTDQGGRTDTDVTGLFVDAPDPPPEPLPVEPAPGTHAAPTGLGLATRTGDDGVQWDEIVWTPAPQVERYRVQFDHTGPGCARSTSRIVEPSPSPSQVRYPNLCGEGSTAQVRVGAEFGATIAWSGWLPLDLPAHWAAPDILEPPGG